MTIPNPERRDIGPYESTEQVLREFYHWAHKLPLSPTMSTGGLLIEAAMMAGAKPTQFEMHTITDLGTDGKIDPMLATILHGWLIRVAVDVDNEVRAFVTHIKEAASPARPPVDDEADESGPPPGP